MSAIGGEDYVSLDREVSLIGDDERMCVGIIILEDAVVEEDESFQVIVEGYDTSVTVTILDDDGSYNGSFFFFKFVIFAGVLASFIGNSPVVCGNTISFDLSFRGDVISARCGLLIGKKQQILSIDCKFL